MSKLAMLIMILLLAALIPVNFSASTAENPSGNETSSPGVSPAATSDDLDNQQGSTSMSKPQTPTLLTAFQLLNQVDDLIDQLLRVLGELLSPITLPISILVKALLTPVIFLVRILLLIVKILLDILLRGLVRFVLAPLLQALGLGELIPVIKGVLDIVDLLLDRVSCLLGLLSFFSGILPGCNGKSAAELWSSDIGDAALAMYDKDVSTET